MGNRKEAEQICRRTRGSEMSGYVLGRHGDQATWARWGNVGQTFEAVNSIVSALAVAGILITWIFQSRQMQVAQSALQRTVDANLRYLFASPKVRAFWRDTANSRQSIYVEGAAELGLAAMANEIWAEYEAVLACSAEAPPHGAGCRAWETENLQAGEPLPKSDP
jgi:hypothetical protein